MNDDITIIRLVVPVAIELDPVEFCVGSNHVVEAVDVLESAVFECDVAQLAVEEGGGARGLELAVEEGNILVDTLRTFFDDVEAVLGSCLGLTLEVDTQGRIHVGRPTEVSVERRRTVGRRLFHFTYMGLGASFTGLCS